MVLIKQKLDAAKVSEFNDESDGLIKRFYFTLYDLETATKLFTEIFENDNKKSQFHWIMIYY